MIEELRHLLPVAHAAVDLGQRVIHSRRPLIMTAKGDRDLVTELDISIEHEVRDFLAARIPSISFLGEEEGRRGEPNSDLMWTLDPIDGTVNFLHGLPLCAISLGLLRGSQPVLGVIDLPFLARRYHGVIGRGAHLNGRPIMVSDTAKLHDAVVAVGDFAVGSEATSLNRDRLAVITRLAARAQRVRMIGTAAIDLAWLAEGAIDASITLSNNPWDMCAGVVIAREAGAEVVDRDGTPHSLYSSATIGANPALLAEVLQQF